MGSALKADPISSGCELNRVGSEAPSRHACIMAGGRRFSVRHLVLDDEFIQHIFGTGEFIEDEQDIARIDIDGAV